MKLDEPGNQGYYCDKVREEYIYSNLVTHGLLNSTQLNSI